MPELRTIPGPKGHWFMGSINDMRRDVLGFYSKAQKEYGDYLRFRAPLGFKWHAFSSPDAIHHILVKNHSNYTKGAHWTRAVSMLGGNGLVTSQGEFWQKQRKLMSPTFHRERVIGFADTMVATATEVTKEWNAEAGKEKDFYSEMMRLTLRIICKVIFSIDISAKENELGKIVTESFDYVNYRVFHPFAAPLWMPTPRNLHFRKTSKALDDYVYEIIAARRSSGGDEKDVLSMLMAERHEEDNAAMTDKQLRDEVVTLMISGHETLSCTLAWVWYLLATNPQEEEKLKSELDTILGGKQARFEDIAQLKYTRMVLDESMRLYPAAWAIPRYAENDDEIEGYKIKKGSIIALLTSVTQRDPKYWDKPNEFNPENFTEDKISKRPKYAYYPFGGGPRQCIGIQIALMEGVLVLATLMQHYKPALPENYRVKEEVSFTLKPKDGLRVILEKR